MSKIAARLSVLVILVSLAMIGHVSANPFDENNSLKVAASVNDVIELANASPKNRDELLKSGVKHSKSPLEVIKLADSAKSKETVNIILNNIYVKGNKIYIKSTGKSSVIYLEDLISLAESCSNWYVRDSLLKKGIPLTANIPDYITLARSCQNKEIADEILMAGIKKARGPYEFIQLAEKCESLKNHDRIIYAGATSVSNLSEVTMLVNAAHYPKVKAKIAAIGSSKF
ncbi:MAG: hypothetical protein HQM10_08905 [Candidatus Riflebacteria bacterium]|nr:hypothetical protein [Candidatus Riflebacteria bacterium]